MSGDTPRPPSSLAAESAAAALFRRRRLSSSAARGDFRTWKKNRTRTCPHICHFLFDRSCCPIAPSHSTSESRLEKRTV